MPQTTTPQQPYSSETVAAAMGTVQQAQSLIVDLTRQQAEIAQAITRQQAIIDAMLPYVTQPTEDTDEEPAQE